MGQKKINDLFGTEMTAEINERASKFKIPKFFPGDEAFERSTCERVVIKTVNVEAALKDQTGKRDEGITSMISYLIVGSTERFYEAQFLSREEMLDYLEKDYQEKLNKVLTA